MLFAGLVKTSLIVCLLLHVMISSKITAFAHGDFHDFDDAEFQREVIAKYPGFFHTLEEVKAMEEDLRKMDKAGIKDTFAKEGVDETDGRTEGTISHVTGDTINHACCSSQISLVPHEYLIDIKGKPVQLVQHAHYSQVFHTETCVQDPDCNYCPCVMTNITFMALVYTHYPACSSECILKMGSVQGITPALVLAPSVCRCLNNLKVDSVNRPSSSSEHTEL